MAKKARTSHRIREIMEATTRRVALYLRRSTDEDHQPFSLEAQETKLRAFVESQPGEWLIVAVYSDDASGATTEREELQKMLRAARAGLFDTLLVYRVDRFSRRLRDLVGLLDELAEAEVVFRSATEPFDTSTPVGRMLVQMLGVFAEFEREVIIDRVIAGMERKAAKGLWNGGARPLGYVIDKTSHKLAITETEASTVRLIFDSYTKDRLGTQAIATLLNERGIRTRMGKPWSQHAVEHVVTNRVYIGEKRFRDIAAANAHEAIVTAKQFDLAQRILGQRSAEIGRRAANPSDFTLTGKIRCPRCGKNYVGTAAHGRYDRYRYYVCWTRARYGTKAGCDIYRFNANELETAISQALLDFYTTSHDLIAAAAAEFQATHTTSTSSHLDQLATINAQLKDVRAAVDRYLTAFERGTLDDEDEDVQNRLSMLKSQSKQLRARKAQLDFELDQPPTAPAPAELTQISDHIRHVLARDEVKAKKALFEALIEEIVIQSDDALVPIFRIPMLGKAEGLALDGPAHDQQTGANGVRTLPRMVGPTGFEPSGSGAGGSAKATNANGDRGPTAGNAVGGEHTRPLERIGREPSGDAAVDSEPANAIDPLSRMLSRLSGLVDPDVLATMVDVEVNVMDRPMAGDRLGDLIRGLAAAATRAGAGLRTELDEDSRSGADAAKERRAGPSARVPRPRTSSSAPPRNRIRNSAKRRRAGVTEVE